MEPHHGYMTPPAIIMYQLSSYLGELLVGIKPKISRSIAHPKTPTTTMYLKILNISLLWFLILSNL